MRKVVEGDIVYFVNADLQKHGPYIARRDGRVVRACNYADGVLSGEYKSYDSYGTLRMHIYLTKRAAGAVEMLDMSAEERMITYLKHGAPLLPNDYMTIQ